MEGNMNTGSFDASAIPPGIILALPAPTEGDGRGGPPQRRRQASSQSTARAPSQPGKSVVSDGSNPKDCVKGFVIKAGEDIGEKLRSYFQDRNHFPSGDHARVGTILSATGTISSPTIWRAGSTLFYEGTHCIIELKGCFSIPINGPVEQSASLNVVFHHADGNVEGGPVIGGLIAATPVQVVAGSFIRED